MPKPPVHIVEEVAGRKWIVRTKPPHLRARYNFGSGNFDIVECHGPEEKKEKLLTKARLFARSAFTYGRKNIFKLSIKNTTI